MTTIRKLITFPAPGAALLERAVGTSRKRAAGDYLTAVLRQRRTAWVDALNCLLVAAERREIRAALQSMDGVDPSFYNRAVPSPQLELALKQAHIREGSDIEVNAFCDVLLEWNAGHAGLLKELEGGDK